MGNDIKRLPITTMFKVLLVEWYFNNQIHINITTSFIQYIKNLTSLNIGTTQLEHSNVGIIIDK